MLTTTDNQQVTTAGCTLAAEYALLTLGIAKRARWLLNLALPLKASTVINHAFCALEGELARKPAPDAENPDAYRFVWY